jgi:RNA polymerase sigma factor (sigma-70 family)
MNDEDLILQIQRGNNNAFRHLVDKYRNMVWYLVLRMVKNREEAEDLSQEVFIRVYKNLSKFRGDSKLSTWIGSVAFHVSTDYLRKKSREKVFITGEPSRLEISLPDRESPFEVLKKEDIKELVHKIIEDLPLQYRTVITLYHLEQFSYNEIAEITGMPEGTVKSYINRGRSAIKEALTKLVPDMQYN